LLLPTAEAAAALALRRTAFSALATVLHFAPTDKKRLGSRSRTPAHLYAAADVDRLREFLKDCRARTLNAVLADRRYPTEAGPVNSTEHEAEHE
jgi:hypothetical protein